MKRLISFLLSVLMILGAFAIPAASSDEAETKESVASSEKVYGDANRDGTLNITDAIDLAKYVTGWELETFSHALADYTMEGDLNILDAIRIAEVITGYDYDPEQTLIENSGIEVIDFEVEEPTPTEVVSSAEFGFDTEADDNRAAFQAAADYLVQHPGTTLLIEPGIYKMSGGITINGAKNCSIDGGGATFLYRSVCQYFYIVECDGFMMHNFTFKWDYEAAGPNSSTYRIRSITPTDEEGCDLVEFEFYLIDDASYLLNQNKWFCLTLLDPETMGPGTRTDEVGLQNLYGVDAWIDFSTLQVKEGEPNVLTAKVRGSGWLGTVGTIWRMRHYASGRVFQVHNSCNLTFKDVDIWSTPAGTVHLTGAKTHHVRMANLNVGVDKDQPWETLSHGSDSIHINSIAGYFIIENCDMGNGGEDILNVHSNPGLVDHMIDETHMYVRTRNFHGTPFNPGDVLNFKDPATYEDYGFTATVLSVESAGGQDYIVEFDKPIPEEYTAENTILWNPERTSGNFIIRNNYFHQSSARAHVIGSPNGLIENNHYYGFTMSEAISFKVDYQSLWCEGIETKNFIIRNNIFEACSTAYQEDTIPINFSAVNRFTSMDGICFRNFLIYNNVFKNNFSKVICINQVENVTFAHNIIDDTMSITDTYTGNEMNWDGRGRVNVTGKVSSVKKIKVFDNTWLESPYISDNTNEVDAAYAFISGGKVTDKNNTKAEPYEYPLPSVGLPYDAE